MPLPDVAVIRATLEAGIGGTEGGVEGIEEKAQGGEAVKSRFDPLTYQNFSLHLMHSYFVPAREWP